MKRCLLIIGLLLSLAPLSSQAAEISETCKVLRSTTPVSSHYVQKVLERADAGLAKARAASDNPGLEKYFFSWAERIEAAANSLIGSYTSLAQTQRDFLQSTTCLHVDMLFLDCKIDETQTAMQDQLERKSILGIVQLESLLGFLKERKTHLWRGASDPDYSDSTWNKEYAFDTAGSPTSPQVDQQPLCPFDSDYAPSGSDGYGCDATVLDRLSAYGPARAEKESLQKLEQELESYKSLGAEFGSLEKDLNALYEGKAATTVTPPSEAKKKEHREVYDCATKEKPLPEDLRLRSVRTPFSYDKNELAVLSDFLGKRAAQGMFRKQEGILQYASEIEDPQEREAYEKADYPWQQSRREQARTYFQSISATQGKEEAAIFAAAPDSTLQAADALGDLRKSVGELSRLAGSKDGLRSFVIRFAYFLRRSCVYRPCNTSLERVLRTAYEDACFPYTDGAFLGDSSSNPRWQQCAEKACIPSPDVTLPASCKDVLSPEVWAKTKHK